MSSEGVVGGRVERRIGYQIKRVQHALRVEMDGASRELGMTTARYVALSALGRRRVCRGPNLPGGAS